MSLKGRRSSTMTAVQHRMDTPSTRGTLSLSAGPSPSLDSRRGGNGTSGPSKKRLPQLRRDEIAYLVSMGHVLVLHRRSVYHLNSWLAKHPGGHLAILHFIGRDAANEIEAYHCERTLQGLMRSFIIAQVHVDDFAEGLDSEGWKPLVPPVQVIGKEGAFSQISDYASVSRKTWKQDLQSIHHHDRATEAKRLLEVEALEPPSPPAGVNPKEQYRISRAWETLHTKLQAEGFYEARPGWNYRTDIVRYLVLFSAFLYVFVNASTTWHYYAAAVLLGVFWHQVTFLVHDAGHTEVFGDYHADRIFGTLIASWFGGLSVDWWCDNHNIHHLVTNHPEHDPDIQHIPFFAVSTRFFNDIYSSYYRRTLFFDGFSKFFVKLQDKLYYVVMALGRFNLFLRSYEYILLKAKPGLYRNLEMLGIVFFWAWFGLGILRNIPDFWTRLGFVVVSFIVTSPLHVQIVLSHWGQSTDDMGLYESFPSRQLRTTMDVDCAEWIEFIHGGLHMQVTHHLFPRIPRHHLRKASPLIRAFAQENNLPYQKFQFVEGNRHVLGVLRQVADQVSVLGKVASAQARGELDHH